MTRTNPHDTGVGPEVPLISRPVHSALEALGDRVFHTILLLISFAVRLYSIGRHSLWYDETVSVHLSSLSLLELIVHTARDIHPPGYYMLLRMWRLVTDSAPHDGLELIYAFPSVFFGLLIIAILPPIVRRMRLPATVASIAMALAVIHPFQIWYSQEVRMYTLAAFLGLLALWLCLRWIDVKSPSSQSVALAVSYAATGALSLYVLYYAGFLLAGLSLLMIWSLIAKRFPRPNGWKLAQIVGINALLLALWMPWLPTFIRQVTNPPVPAWREPWHTWPAFMSALTESIAALFIGQTLQSYYWLIVPVFGGMVIISVLYCYAKRICITRELLSVAICCVAIPFAALFLISALYTPVYHVRYTFIFSPIALIIMSALFHALKRIHPSLLGVAIGSIIILQLVAIQDYVSNPTLQPDDHRGSVRFLAESWRPGDAILVNAGWIYPVLTTYWPQHSGQEAAVPPPIDRRIRLDNVVSELTANSAVSAKPILIMAGSIDGDGALGWGLESSDFYPTTAEKSQVALNHVNQLANRIWHYRQYDTVNDSHGLIRQWLSSEMQLLFSRAIPGRDFGRLELFASTVIPALPNQNRSMDAVQFGPSLVLQNVQTELEAEAGYFHYVELLWSVRPATQAHLPNLAMSLRLFAGSDEVLAQHDESPYVSTNEWIPDQTVRQVLALPIPSNLEAGSYTIGLLVYDTASLEPVAVTANPRQSPTDILKIATIEVY